MKKLSLKQRMRQPKPRRKTPHRVPSVVMMRPPSIDGYVVRLPAEPHPNKPVHPLIPVYVGWGGRALHVQLALIFENQDDAARAAAGFPNSSIESCDLNDRSVGMEPVAWMEIAMPDRRERERVFGKDSDQSSEAERAKMELEDRLLTSLTMPDDRAPRDEALKPQVIETIIMNSLLNLQLLPPSRAT